MEQCVMVIASHPDDAELGLGGTIAALIKSNIRVVVVDLTDGEPTPHGSPEIRKKESGEASRVLGITERVTLDIKNREIFDTVENRKKVATVIRKYKPDIIFTHYWEDSHPDHVEACKLVEAARFYAKFVKTDMEFAPHTVRRLLYYFSIHIRLTLTPSFIFDISDCIEQKIKAMEAYHSQFMANDQNMSVIEKVRIEASYWGTQIGVSYGEPIMSREQIGIRSGEVLLKI